MMQRNQKTLTIQIGGREVTVSLNRMKSAFLPRDTETATSTLPPASTLPPTPTPARTTTRSGRTQRLPARFRDYECVTGGHQPVRVSRQEKSPGQKRPPEHDGS
jgi:hypothetical protein